MADITQANLEPDLRLADLIQGAVRTELVDLGSVRNVPGAIDYIGDIQGMGTDTPKIKFVNLDGSSEFSTPTNPDDLLTDTAITDRSVGVVVTRKGISRSIEDLAEMTSFDPSDVSVQRLARSMAAEAEATWMSHFGDMVEGFTNVAGTTGVAFALADWYAGQFDLQLRSVPGPYFALLSPAQINGFQSGLSAAGGATQWQPATAAMLQIKGQGYAGNFNGIEVYKSSRVNVTALDAQGAMWGAGALAHATGTPRPAMGAVQARPNSQVTVEFDRVARGAETLIWGHAYWGMSIADQARGCRLISLG